MSVKGLFSKVLNLLLKIISKSENTKKIGLTSQIHVSPGCVLLFAVQSYKEKLK